MTRRINGTAPDFDYLPEADIADMDYFLEQLRVVLPSIGLDFLRETPKRVEFQPHLETSDVLSDEKGATSSRLVQRNIQSTLRARPTFDGASSPVFEIKRPNLEAVAMELEGSFVVLKGSEARKDTRPSIGSNVKSTREQLLHAGKLAPSKKSDLWEFQEDIAFSSPSAASQAVYGTSRNGRVDWVIQGTDQTYASWQEEQLQSIQIEPAQ